MEHVYAIHLLITGPRKPSTEHALLTYRTRDYSDAPIANLSEEADPRFWTAYDFYTMEREARAKRRDYLFRTALASSKRLYQRIHRSIPSASRALALRRC
jgi:hypothetical protein